MSGAPASAMAAPRRPSLREAALVWTRIALLSFGGPAGQIAVMHRILVEEQRWLGDARFLHALNFCMLLPGPEAQQLATYIGWLMHRTVGGLVAGIIFVLPGVVAIMALSWLYAAHGDLELVGWLFFGLKAAVLAIVLVAVQRIGRRALPTAPLLAVAGVSFVAIFVFAVPFPLIIATAAIGGYLAGRRGHRSFGAASGHAAASDGVANTGTVIGEGVPAHAVASGSHTKRLAAWLLALWLVPIAALVLGLGADNVYASIAVFFGKLAVVTFGGAYAVLAYVAQAAVDTHGWLNPGEMLDGLGMAETTPGPLIMVTQFVGFMAAFREPGSLPPMLAATLGGLLATWVTFVPCFLWIFVGAPHAERLRDSLPLRSALTAITAAVVGVVLNLALWFALHVIFREVSTFERFGIEMSLPDLVSIDPWALGLSIIALVAVFRWRLGTGWLLLGAAILGIASGWARGVFG